MDGTSAIDGRFPGENPLRTVLYLMYPVMSPFFTKPMLTSLAQDPSARDEIKNRLNAFEDVKMTFETCGLCTQALNMFPICGF